ncbi:unnamed protein product, partial [Prorocentrum cordatum]
NVIYVDPCRAILWDRPRGNFDEQASRGESKRWTSPDAKAASPNLLASPCAAKQTQFRDKKIRWFIAVFRGGMRCETMGSKLKQTGAGVAQVVGRLERILRANLGNGTPFPRLALSDRGPGLYRASTGPVVGECCDALEQRGFRAYAGADASKQPPDIPDGLGAMGEELAERLKARRTCANRDFEVGALRSSYPERMKELVGRRGERLNRWARLLRKTQSRRSYDRPEELFKEHSVTRRAPV